MGISDGGRASRPHYMAAVGHEHSRAMSDQKINGPTDRLEGETLKKKACLNDIVQETQNTGGAKRNRDNYTDKPAKRSPII